MTAATERIVVQVTAQDKRDLAAKARRLSMPLSELVRRAAFAFEGESGSDSTLEPLADRARQAAERAGAAIDDALDFIKASNRRMAALEAAAARPGVAA